MQTTAQAALVPKEVDFTMMRSLSSAVSGLKAHQEWIDVIGNNIANVNTSGYKKSRVSFQDMLYQTIQSASRPASDGSTGGTNPMQIGPGVSVSSIDTIMDGNTLQYTGKNTDLGIDGDGFFCLADGGQKYYTRTGNFSFDSNGNLVSANGMKVQGWLATNGVFPAQLDESTMGDIKVATLGGTISAKATTKIAFGGNLSADDFGSINPVNYTVADSSGKTATMTLTMTPSNTFGVWNYAITASGGAVSGDGATGTISMDNNGNISAINPDGGSFSVVVTPSGGSAVSITPPSTSAPDNTLYNFGADAATGALTNPASGSITINPVSVPVQQTVYDSLGNQYTVTTTFTRTGSTSWSWSSSVTTSSGTAISPVSGNTGTISFDSKGKLNVATGGPISFDPGNGADTVSISPDFSAMTSNAAATSALAQSQDGYQAGSLQSITFDTSGAINGVYSNGVTQALARVALANFSNPSGLQREGDTMFSESNNSGTHQIGYAGKAGYGSIKPGNLEASNVDLASEFSDMITAQRGFEANSKVITVSDQMLSDLVNMIR